MKVFTKTPSSQPVSGPNPSGEPRTSFFGRLRKHFLTGLLVTTPIVFTVYVTWQFITWIDGLVVGAIPPTWNPMAFLPYQIPGLGLVAVFLLLVFIGAFAAGYMGRMLVSISEFFLAHMPVVRSIYSATKQVMETVFSNQASAFRQVVMVEFPRAGVWSLGFLTGKTMGEVQDLTTEEVINVFVPTTPNPTSGFLIFVPRKDIVPLAMSVEEGIKMIMSAGIITPPHKGQIRPVLMVDPPAGGQPEAR